MLRISRFSGNTNATIIEKINISVKAFDSNDFINLTDYIYKLQFHSYNYTATTLTNSSDVLLSSAEAIENLSKFL